MGEMGSSITRMRDSVHAHRLGRCRLCDSMSKSDWCQRLLSVNASFPCAVVTTINRQRSITAIFSSRCLLPYKSNPVDDDPYTVDLRYWLGTDTIERSSVEDTYELTIREIRQWNHQIHVQHKEKVMVLSVRSVIYHPDLPSSTWIDTNETIAKMILLYHLLATFVEYLYSP